MSPTHPFRTSRKSPLDDNGPNSAAHRRSLASLQTHDRGTPLARRSLAKAARPAPSPLPRLAHPQNHGANSRKAISRNTEAD